jgi:hypothetical protein
MTLTLGRLLGKNMLLVGLLALETVGGLLETLPGTLVIFNFWHYKLRNWKINNR